MPEGVRPADDLWLLEFSYEQAAEYHQGFAFGPSSASPSQPSPITRQKSPPRLRCCTTGFAG
jgi:hypothetical protein